MLDTEKWKTKNVRVTSLRLDDSNIRLESVSPSQDAIIQDLFTNYKTMQIVESILRFGFFTHELPIVVKERAVLVVLEGNRRTAALKAILNPKLVPKHEKKIRALIKAAGDISALESVEVKVATSRESASRVIATIHTIRSRISWRPLRQAYFYFAQIESGNKTVEDLKKEYPSVDIPNFVKMWEMHSIARSIKYDSTETQSKVSSRNFPISTFARVYNNELFKKKARIHFTDEGRVVVESDKKQFKKLIKRLVTDIADKNIDSRLLNKMDSEPAKKYLNSLAAPAKAKSKTTADDFKPLPETVARKTKLVPENIECDLAYPAVNKMFSELKKIPYGKYPNATHDFLRSFFECLLKVYLKESGFTPKRSLDGVIKQTMSHFESIDEKGLKQVMQTLEGQGPYLHSKDYLNAINHNPYIFSIGENVENAWESMEPVIRFILKSINQK